MLHRQTQEIQTPQPDRRQSLVALKLLPAPAGRVCWLETVQGWVVYPLVRE